MRTRIPLPTEATQRALALVEASRPNPDRPRLNDPELEARMVAAESDQAIRHALREDLCDRIERVTQIVDESEDGTISVSMDDDDNSVVHHAVDLMETASVQIPHKGG